MVINRRKSKRLKVKSGIVMTPDEVCQIIDLNKKGFSFKCVNKQFIARQSPVDIYDTSGLSLEQLQINKVWEKYVEESNKSSPFLMKVGVEFATLTPEQETLLNSYLRQLEELENCR